MSDPIFTINVIVPKCFGPSRTPRLLYANISEYPNDKTINCDTPDEAFKIGEKLADMDNIVVIEEHIREETESGYRQLDRDGSYISRKLWFLPWAADKWIETTPTAFSHIRFRGDLQFEAIEISNKYGDDYLTKKYFSVKKRD